MYILISALYSDWPTTTPFFDFNAVKLGVAKEIECYSKELNERIEESAYNRDKKIAEATKDYDFLISILKSEQNFDIDITTKTWSRLIILGDVIECSLKNKEVKDYFINPCNIQSQKVNIDKPYPVYEVLFNLI